MAKLRIANVAFEAEMEKDASSLEEVFRYHQVYLQLQFLPFLYADKEDLVLVTDAPEPSYLQRLETLGISTPSYELISNPNFPFWEIDAWGPTPSLAAWAQRLGLHFTMPSWDIVKRVNSKEFSFIHSPKLAGATLLYNEGETKRWLANTPGPKVIKSLFGLSGRGHCFLSEYIDAKALTFLHKEWNKGLAVLAEPWVDRIFDFSTQWHISREGAISYYGPTICLNDRKGSYRKTLIYPADTIGEDYAPFLIEHKRVAQSVLEKMLQQGYFGHVGFDAMVYKKQSALALHPIVEINARKTMGWVALMLQRKHFSSDLLLLQYTHEDKEHNLLPNMLLSSSHQSTAFSKALRMEILAPNKSWKDVYF